MLPVEKSRKKIRRMLLVLRIIRVSRTKMIQAIQTKVTQMEKIPLQMMQARMESLQIVRRQGAGLPSHLQKRQRSVFGFHGAVPFVTAQTR